MDRDDLVERVAEGLRNNSLEEMGDVETAPFSAAPVDLREYWVKRARIALEIIEPAVREECARVCDARHMGDNNREDQEARRCAAAIRAGANP